MIAVTTIQSIAVLVALRSAVASLAGRYVVAGAVELRRTPQIAQPFTTASHLLLRRARQAAVDHAVCAGCKRPLARLRRKGQSRWPVHGEQARLAALYPDRRSRPLRPSRCPQCPRSRCRPLSDASSGGTSRSRSRRRQQCFPFLAPLPVVPPVCCEKPPTPAAPLSGGVLVRTSYSGPQPTGAGASDGSSGCANASNLVMISPWFRGATR